nr:RNA-binding protein 25-like [Ipomoea batatas]
MVNKIRLHWNRKIPLIRISLSIITRKSAEPLLKKQHSATHSPPCRRPLIAVPELLAVDLNNVTRKPCATADDLMERKNAMTLIKEGDQTTSSTFASPEKQPIADNRGDRHCARRLSPAATALTVTNRFAVDEEAATIRRLEGKRKPHVAGEPSLVAADSPLCNAIVHNLPLVAVSRNSHNQRHPKLAGISVAYRREEDSSNAGNPARFYHPSSSRHQVHGGCNEGEFERINKRFEEMNGRMVEMERNQQGERVQDENRGRNGRQNKREQRNDSSGEGSREVEEIRKPSRGKYKG